MSGQKPGRHAQDGVVFTQIVMAADGGRVNAVQHGDQYNYIYRGSPPYRVEPFPFPDAGVVPAGLARVPSRLLTARHQVVPFAPRPELDQLEAWRDDTSAGLSVRLVHAEGGQGKTRLATEFAARSAQAGWAVALARHRSEVASAGGGDEQLTVRAPGLVLIVDYADRWPAGDLITLVRQHQGAARDRLRILLLARPAGIWWQGLAHQLAKLGIFDAGAIRMHVLPDGPTGRAGMYAAARDRFAEIFAIADPAAIAGPADFSDPVFALTLTVHMRALVDVDAAARCQPPPAGSGQADLSSYLLDREHDHWRSAHDGGHGPIRATEETMGRAVYIATLTRPLPPADAAEALVRADVAGAPQACAGLLDDHARCYPPEDPALALEPLYPDRLGEDYLALTLPGHEDQFGYHATDTWTLTAPALLLTPAGQDLGPASWTRQAMTTLIETARRWPHITTDHLRPLLTAHPDLALHAGGTALTVLTNLPGIDLTVLEAIEALLPVRRHTDLDTGIAALTQHLADHRLSTTREPAERAGILTGLAYRLSHAGLHQKALTATQESVEICRQLAQANPAAFEPDLATSLSNLGAMLSQLGRRQEALGAAQESVETYRRLARTNPAAFEPDLARSLSNLGIRLSRPGRRREASAAAQESVTIRRRLARTNPAAFEPDLATSLSKPLG